MKYDYIVVGAGLFGATFTHLARSVGKSVLIIEARDEIGGNCATYYDNGIVVHKYGAHIFHTHDKYIWDYVNSFDKFYNYINSPIANYNGELYNLPFNMNTFYKMWGLSNPKDVRDRIKLEVKRANISDPNLNLETKAISLVGEEVYEKLIKHYTEKQWGTECKNLPSNIITRLPVRFIFDNNYFNDNYQGIPEHGYSYVITNMIGDTEIVNTDYLLDREYFNSLADKVIYTGRIDRYFGYFLGVLEYRGVKFDHKLYDTDNYQGNAVINYTGNEEYTRSIEHRHFMKFCDSDKTIVSYEYPMPRVDINEAIVYSSYTVNTSKNIELLNKYKSLEHDNVIFAGRLGEYKYYDMDDTIINAVDLFNDVNY